jgi:probable HAF family extracellular repeat protein
MSRPLTTRIVLALGAAAATAPAAALAQATFEPLGRLRPGDGSNAWGVSANGAVVVGESSPTGFDYRAFRATGPGALQDLGSLPGVDPTARALDVSADGSVVVGDSGFGPNVNYTRAFRWTAAGGMVDLGHPSGRPTDVAVAWAVSADGRVVVGQADSDTGSQAFRWTTEGGMAGLGALGPRGSAAFAVSADGSVVVGITDGPGDVNGRMFRWTPQAGMQVVPGPPGLPQDVSADGSTIVGVTQVRPGSIGEPFRWTEANGMEILDTAPDNFKEMAKAVSGDGSVVVGHADFGAFIWDPKNGFRNLRTVLVDDYGLADALEGWTLGTAEDISADGTTIVGGATGASGQFQAYRVVLPEPTAAALLAPFLPLLILRRQREGAEKIRSRGRGTD